MSRLRVEGLRFHRCGPLDLVIEAGECVALSGPSGSGKTLLLRALADLDLHEGRVWLNGTECAATPAPDWRRRVGLLSAESRWWHDTVGEHFDGAAPEGLERLGFKPEVLAWSVARLSSGERQRLALLRLLANRPEALLLDEPTANLDGEATARVEALVADTRKRTGAALLWVTHDPAQARRVAGRSLRLERGRLVGDDA